MSLKAKITILSVAVTGAIIAALFAVQANNVVDSWLGSTYDTAELVANHAKHLLILRLQQHSPAQDQTGDALATASGLLRPDRDFDALLEGTMAQARSVVEISVSGSDGKIIASSSPFRNGSIASPLPELGELRGMPPFRRVLRVMNYPANYQVALPLQPGNEPGPLYTIRVVVSSVLLREDLRPALWRVAKWGVAGIICSVFLAWASARLLTGNLTHISTALDRITRGEEPEHRDHHGQLAGEFTAIESRLKVLGHQFRGAAQLRSALDKVLDGAREGILLVGDDGKVTLAGGAVGDLLGVSGSDLNGRLLAQVIPPDTPSAQALISCYHARQAVREQRLEWRSNGAARHLIVSLDFTGGGESRNAKSALLRIRDAASHRDLESQIGRIARLDAMSRITSGVAHEIKNPLNSITVRLDNLQARAEREFPEAWDEIALIVREIERLDGVVRTFLDFTRPVEIAGEWFSLTHLMNEIVSLVEPGAVRRGIRVTFAHTPEDVWVRGDEGLLKEGILNIATNAVEAMNGDGDLRLQLEQEAKQAHITVADTGPGIPDSLREKIFELYYTTKKNGSGLGLPMAFRAVQLHGGTIRIDSTSQRGAVFHICLPNEFKTDGVAV
jgi:signal transduction histidine kinase